MNMAFLWLLVTSAAFAQSNKAISLDQGAEWFALKTTNVESSPECFPVLVSRDRQVNLHYLYCSAEAFEQESKAVQVTDNFSVSPSLARRFHFWRRVYSLWTHEQYVLHSAGYTDVVFEVADSSIVKGSDAQKHSLANKVLDARRDQYRSLLTRMAKMKSEQFSPAMKRVEALMTHIQDPQKYERAALDLRIQRGQRTMIATGLITASRYLHAVENAFYEEGIPPELAKIAFIESSFNLKARSKVGASGVYQIMPATGREFKLIINDEIDERHDPIKAAHAAAKLLRSNYAVTNAWPLAVTGYNHGVNGIRRAVREVGSNQIEDLIERYDGPAFGFASKNFFTGFLALMATVSQADKIFPDVPRLEPLRYAELKLHRATPVRSVMKEQQMTTEVLMDYNPDLTRTFVARNGTLPRGFTLKIPLQQEVASNP